MKRVSSVLVAGALALGLSANADAASFSGKFDLVQTGSSGSTTNIRFYNAASGLSIFTSATDPNGSLLQGAFLRKASVDIGYTPIVCPPGYSGTCGNLYWINVSTAAIP